MWIFKDDLQRNLFAVGISKISLFYFKNNTIKKIKFLTKEKNYLTWQKIIEWSNNIR